MCGGETTIRGRVVPFGKDVEAPGDGGGESVIFSSHDVMSDKVSVGTHSSGGKSSLYLSLHRIASFMRSNRTDSRR